MYIACTYLAQILVQERRECLGAAGWFMSGR